MPHTLLLADDSVAIQRVIELTFAGEDVQVITVDDGDQAIARMEASPPDIVLADIGMARKNGYELAQYVKETPRLAHIPVVLLTGAFEPIDQARASAAGCEEVLAKPFEPQLVMGRVMELLARGSRAADTDAPSAAAAPAPDGDAWLAPLAAPVAKPASELDHYFDELDVALSNLKTPESRSGAEVKSASQADAGGPGEPAAEQFDHDWFGALNAIDDSAARETVIDDQAPSGSAPDPALSYASPAADFEPREMTAAEPSDDDARSTEAPASSVPARPPTFSEPQVAASASTASTVSDEVIDQIAQRVLAQLSDRIVRDTVAEIVSGIAERLVREEIQRIKDAVQ